MPALSRLLMLAAVAAAPLAAPAAAASDPLAPYRWKSRVLVALAPRADDPALAAQRRLFAGLGAAARERDLVLVEAADDTPRGTALRRRFGGEGFRAVLVGKDGGEKLSAAEPLGPGALFPVIDAMPMRQDEMARRR